VAAEDLLLRCNGFEILSLLDDIALHLVHGSGAMALSLQIMEEDSGAMIRLCWTGQPLGIGDLDRWLTEPLDRSVPEIPCRSVLTSHGTELWPEPLPDGRQSLCLPIRQARRATAVRIVNGRRVEGEVFDTLVNPRRSVPLSSTEVHGITEAMVADAPDVDDVLRLFHKFAEGAVLIAPFDMQFLPRREAKLGLAFDHPILDTVLLSAVIYGQHETHGLDALTRRLGITIPEADRHTAIGDTVATADSFLKLKPMLQGRNLKTFGDVLSEVRNHGRLLKDLN
jgi:DNA polymerase III subunit epsilon